MNAKVTKPVATPGGEFPRVSEPALVTLLRFGKDPLGLPGKYFESYGDTFATSLFGERMVMTRDPYLINEVLISKSSDFVKDKTTRALSRLLGDGLLTSEGDAWRERRRAFQPHFQPMELERYAEMFVSETQREIESWKDGTTIDLHPVMTRLTMRLALRSLFGADPDDFGSFESIMSAAMRYFEGIAGTQAPLPPWVPTKTNRDFTAARRQLRERFGEIVRSARKVGRSDTLLAQMLSAQESKKLTDEEVIDESITMLVAGHETSALTLTYTLHLLATHPLAQNRVRKELNRNGTPTSVEACRETKDLMHVISESLRLYPVAWAVGREARRDVVTCGHELKRGTQVYVHQWQAHRHPDYFEKPEQFLPERWAGGLSKSLPKGLYAPFGAGPRTCIGNHFALAEISLVLATILGSFEVIPHDTTPLQFRASITARPRDPVQVRVRRR